MKNDDFIKRQNCRSEKIQSMIHEFGSIESIPDEMKHKLIEEAKKDLPYINAIHISILNEEMRKIRKELLLVEIGWVLLSLAMLFKFIVK